MYQNTRNGLHGRIWYLRFPLQRRPLVRFDPLHQRWRQVRRRHLQHGATLTKPTVGRRDAINTRVHTYLRSLRLRFRAVLLSLRRHGRRPEGSCHCHRLT